MEPHTISLARQMQAYTKEERRQVMEAAHTLADYSRTDPEMQEWQALEAEDFYDVDAALEE